MAFSVRIGDGPIDFARLEGHWIAAVSRCREESRWREAYANISLPRGSGMGRPRSVAVSSRSAMTP